jgi:hypothetical protein
VSTLRKHISAIQLHVDGACVGDGVEAFAKHFYTACSHISPPLSHISVFCFDCLPLVPISDLDIQTAFKRLRQTKSVGLDEIPGFIIRGRSNSSVPYLSTFLISEARQNPMAASSNCACV